LVSVDLQEHVADAQRCALVVGDHDLNLRLFHAGHYREMKSDAATPGRSGSGGELAPIPTQLIRDCIVDALSGASRDWIAHRILS